MTHRLVTQSADISSSLYREYLVHKADLVLLRLELAHARHERLLRKYDPNQPRVPPGNSDGGQWTSNGAYWQSATSRRDEFDARTRILSDLRSEPTLARLTTEQRDANVPADVPHDVDIEANIREAEKRAIFNFPGTDASGIPRMASTYYWFYERVKIGGPWDYKTRGLKYEDFGNFHYGAVGAAAGISEDVLLRMAGYVQVGVDNARRAKNKPAAPKRGKAPSLIEALFGRGGIAPFEDEEKDQYWISKGVHYYQRRYVGRQP